MREITKGQFIKIMQTINCEDVDNSQYCITHTSFNSSKEFIGGLIDVHISKGMYIIIWDNYNLPSKMYECINDLGKDGFLVVPDEKDRIFLILIMKDGI